ncbi:MAG: hypothetical protein VW548_03685, partial [Methylotenera sp.]
MFITKVLFKKTLSGDYQHRQAFAYNAEENLFFDCCHQAQLIAFYWLAPTIIYKISSEFLYIFLFIRLMLISLIEHLTLTGSTCMELILIVILLMIAWFWIDSLDKRE